MVYTFVTFKVRMHISNNGCQGRGPIGTPFGFQGAKGIDPFDTLPYECLPCARDPTGFRILALQKQRFKLGSPTLRKSIWNPPALLKLPGLEEWLKDVVQQLLEVVDQPGFVESLRSANFGTSLGIPQPWGSNHH